MSLPLGTRLGVYEIGGPLGAGGMGEVYRARDTKLNRDVAIKILPDLFTTDADRVARFEREAQVLASLNHPHIAAIYGIEESGGTRALVLEIVEGQTLAERIKERAGRGLAIDETVAIARQIADALEAAHGQGIIHRDLKPANVKMRTDGTVKVLDFGLAKPFDAAGAAQSSSVSRSPTLTAATGMGIILGTAAYMSPEQARGKPVDKRADIWAFGCVLYEMLTGVRAFAGEEVSDTLAFVITRDVDWPALPPDTPSSLRRLLRRCLEKDPKRRLADIADARVELEEALHSDQPPTTTPQSTTIQQRTASYRQRTTASAAAAALLASVITGAGVWSLTRSTPAPPAPVQRFPITIPASAPYIGEAGGEIVISPDGTRLVYPAFEGGKRVLYMRNLDQLEAQPLRGTDDAISPFFSPDGEWVGFFTAPGTPAGKLKKVPAGGGPPITIADADIPTGTWAAGNTIVFTRSPGGPIWRLWKVPAAGGTAAALTTVDLRVKELKHSWPDALPDGKNVLFTVTTGPFFNESHVAVLSLATGAYRTVIDEGYHARYVPSGHGADGRGHIIYALAGNLMAVPFDPGRLETTGPPVPVVEGIRGRTDSGVAGFAVSRTGFLVYSPGTTVATTQRTMVWVDRQGHEEAISAPSRTYTYPRLSPDGARVALDIRDQENDIWIWDLARKSLSRLTFDPAIDSFPVWSPDGRRIAFSSARGGASNLFWQAADGTGQAERLSESPNPQGPQSFSPDGRQLLYRENDPKTNADINLLSLDLSRQVKPLIKTPFSEQNAELSPDGKFVAYQSNESGRDEIYVRPFPDADRGRWQVSTLGGTRPLWAHSGRELFYLAGESARMMAVAVQTGPSFTAGSPQILFDGPYLAASNNSGRTYDVSLDDKRFLMIKTASDASPTAPSSLVAVINWFDELRRVAPPKR